MLLRRARRTGFAFALVSGLACLSPVGVLTYLARKLRRMAGNAWKCAAHVGCATSRV
jgi:hypothetical protein